MAPSFVIKKVVKDPSSSLSVFLGSEKSWFAPLQE